MNLFRGYLLLVLYAQMGLATEEIDVLTIDFGDESIYATNMTFPLESNEIINQLSFCARLNFEDYQYKQIFSIGRDDIQSNEVSLKFHFLDEGIGGLFENEQFQVQFRHPRIYPLQWYHLCLALNESDVVIMLDGQTLEKNMTGDPTNEFKLDLTFYLKIY